MAVVEQKGMSGLNPSDAKKENSIRLAWISVISFPIFYLMAVFVGNLLWAGLGFVNSPSPAPLWQRAIMVVIATIIFAIPATGAIYFGRKAEVQGHKSGNMATWAGGIVLTFLIITNIISAFV